MAAHSPAQPGGVSIAGGTSLAFLSNLAINDRSFDKDLIEVYGKESYIYFMEKLGKKTKVENQTFYHYEVGGKLYAAAQVASATGGASPGVVATITIAAGSHRNSGAESPLRVGEVVSILSSGIHGKITAVNKSSANAHTATIYPLLSTDAFLPSANGWLLFKGLQDVGEGSDTFESIQNTTRKVSNTITEFREDYTILDRAAAERIEWAVKGVQYYQRKGTRDTEKKFLNSIDDKLMFGTVVNNTNLTASGAVGTKGALNQIASGGSSLGYTTGAIAIADFQAMTRIFDQNGAPAEIHHLCDPYQFQEIQNNLFALYPNGAVLWDSVGGSAEAAARYGFKSLSLENYQWHWMKYAPFSAAWKYGVAAAGAYDNYGVVIPQGQHTDPRTSEVGPTFEVCYQDVPGKGFIHAWETGALAPTPTNGKASLTNSFLAYRGLRLKAANQCIIFDGA